MAVAQCCTEARSIAAEACSYRGAGRLVPAAVMPCAPNTETVGTGFSRDAFATRCQVGRSAQGPKGRSRQRPKSNHPCKAIVHMHHVGSAAAPLEPTYAFSVDLPRDHFHRIANAQRAASARDEVLAEAHALFRAPV